MFLLKTEEACIYFNQWKRHNGENNKSKKVGAGLRTLNFRLELTENIIPCPSAFSGLLVISYTWGIIKW